MCTAAVMSSVLGNGIRGGRGEPTSGDGVGCSDEPALGDDMHSGNEHAMGDGMHGGDEPVLGDGAWQLRRACVGLDLRSPSAAASSEFRSTMRKDEWARRQQMTPYREQMTPFLVRHAIAPNTDVISFHQ